MGDKMAKTLISKLQEIVKEDDLFLLIGALEAWRSEMLHFASKKPNTKSNERFCCEQRERAGRLSEKLKDYRDYERKDMRKPLKLRWREFVWRLRR